MNHKGDRAGRNDELQKRKKLSRPQGNLQAIKVAPQFT